jgi:tRNA(Ile)-lysidine synthase
MLNLSPFYTFIKQHALFNTDEKILLAVSGGRDSVLMAHYFKQAGLQFGIAHCNFKLRGGEANAEEQFTSELADEFEVPFYTISFDTTAYASARELSIQMAARELRYNWLEEIRADFHFTYIALAHHQSDAVETILLNLTRGTGISGLHGILPKRDKLIRPLLFHTRDEIDEIIAQEGFEFRDDSSNSSSKYARNKIRLQIVPALKELNPKLDETFRANAQRFMEVEQLLNQRINELKEQLFISRQNDEILIPIKDLKNLKPQQTLVYGLLSPFDFKESVLKDLINALDSQPGKVFESATHLILIDRSHLILSKKGLSVPAELLIINGDNEYYWNDELYRSDTAPGYAFKNKTSGAVVQLDHKLLSFPLKLRSWHKGDYFHPFGMRGKKKLSDYFIEQKINRQHKQNIGILENGNGDILWIAGYRSDDRYKVSATTKKIFILEKVEADVAK